MYDERNEEKRWEARGWRIKKRKMNKEVNKRTVSGKLRKNLNGRKQLIVSCKR